MSELIDKALRFGGWPGLILLAGGGAVMLVYWFWQISQGRYKRVFYWQIIVLPFTFYTARAFGITAYTSVTFDQRLGLTTGLPLFLFLVLLMQKRLKRHNNQIGRTFEYLMWGYCITITLSQLANHSPASALLLSIGAAWQYLVLFYLLISLITNQKDILNLLNAIFLMSLLNILFRVVVRGQSLIIDPASLIAGKGDILAVYGSEIGRVGEGALGQAVEYAGYLAILITLGFGAYWTTRKKIYLLYIAIEFVELLNTFTRGGILILFLLGLLLLFRKTRFTVLKTGFVGLILILPLSPLIWKYISVRGLSLNVMEESNFVLRLELIRSFFEQYSFNLWGNGIYRETVLQWNPWFATNLHNTYLLILDACGPLPFILFVVISIYSLYISLILYRVGVREKTGKHRFLWFLPFVFVAMLQWIIYANVSPLSVLAYFPYEATAVFWIVAFLPVIFANIHRMSVVAAASQMHAVHRNQGSTFVVPVQE